MSSSLCFRGRTAPNSGKAREVHVFLELAMLVIAVALMLGGVVMIFTDVSTEIAFPAIVVGIALTVIVEAEKRLHPRPSH